MRGKVFRNVHIFSHPSNFLEVRQMLQIFRTLYVIKGETVPVVFTFYSVYFSVYLLF